MARKEGTGNVMVNGQVMTQNMYKQAVVDTLNELSNQWLTVDTIISYAANKKWVEPKNRSRRGHSHPLYRIMTTLAETENRLSWRYNNRGILEYRLK